MIRKKHFVYITRSIPNCFGGGDGRRAAQMVDLLSHLGALTVITQRDKAIPHETIELVEQDMSYAAYWRTGWWHWVAERLKEAEHLVQYALQNLDPTAFYIIEDPLFFIPLIRHFEKNKISFWFHIHNIESLIGEHVHEGKKMVLFQKELNLLLKARCVICISQEEYWLLKQYGVHAVYFPYHPVKQVEKTLLDIRKIRTSSMPRSVCLITGSMGNTPTRLGYLKLLEIMREKHPELLGDVLVVGFGVNRYLSDFKEYKVEIRSDVNWDEYQKILIRTRHCLCYQESGGGALCKIPEMLIAGIPVFANAIAARSYHNLTGVYEYQTISQLVSALTSEGPYPMPARPSAPAVKQWLMHAMEESR